MSASDVRLNDGLPGLNRSGRAGGDGHVGDVHDEGDARVYLLLLRFAR